MQRDTIADAADLEMRRSYEVQKQEYKETTASSLECKETTASSLLCYDKLVPLDKLKAISYISAGGLVF